MQDEPSENDVTIVFQSFSKSATLYKIYCMLEKANNPYSPAFHSHWAYRTVLSLMTAKCTERPIISE